MGALTVNQIAGDIIVLYGLYFYNQAENKIILLIDMVLRARFSMNEINQCLN